MSQDHWHHLHTSMVILCERVRGVSVRVCMSMCVVRVCVRVEGWCEGARVCVRICVRVCVKCEGV